MHPYSFFTSTNLIIAFHKIPSKAWFESTLKAIKTFYRFISTQRVENYIYNKENFNNCCNICFDDGHKTVFENALPVLNKMKIPATLFISPLIINGSKNYWFQDYSIIKNFVHDHDIIKIISDKILCEFAKIKDYSPLDILKNLEIEKINEILNTIINKFNVEISNSINISKEQLNELMNNELITIGAHTLSHPILKNEKEEKAINEISQGINELEKLTGCRAKYFAYPNGLSKIDFSNREEAIISKSKIKMAFTTDAGFFNNHTNPLRIPRIGYVGSVRENKIWVLVKLLLVPFWKLIEARKEVNERKKIRNILISSCQ